MWYFSLLGMCQDVGVENKYIDGFVSWFHSLDTKDVRLLIPFIILLLLATLDEYIVNLPDELLKPFFVVAIALIAGDSVQAVVNFFISSTELGFLSHENSQEAIGVVVFLLFFPPAKILPEDIEILILIIIGIIFAFIRLAVPIDKTMREELSDKQGLNKVRVFLSHSFEGLFLLAILFMLFLMNLVLVAELGKWL